MHKCNSGTGTGESLSDRGARFAKEPSCFASIHAGGHSRQRVCPEHRNDTTQFAEPSTCRRRGEGGEDGKVS